MKKSSDAFIKWFKQQFFVNQRIAVESIIVIFSTFLLTLNTIWLTQYKTHTKFKLALCAALILIIAIQALKKLLQRAHQDYNLQAETFLYVFLFYCICLTYWTHCLPYWLISLGNTLSLLSVFFLLFFARKINTVIVLCASVLFGFAFSWLKSFEHLYGPPSFDSYMALFQTDSYESWIYFRRTLDLKEACILILFLVAIAYFTKPKKIQSMRKAWGPILVLLVLSFPASQPALDGLAKRKELFEASIQAFKDEINKQKSLSLTLTNSNSELMKTPAKTPLRLILVMLESVNRNHLGIYGYHRNTTPYLDSIKSELHIHEDSVSPHSYTVPSLTQVLTYASYNQKVTFESAAQLSIPNVLRNAGVHTHWYSAQNEFGSWDNPVSIIGKQAEKYYFL